ncbi:hypothetical protein QTG54_005521 [Skeletonema marinoi]|uniref:Uncharacterized protein n=1 Tax=Skeletonema marinoi TaxID=267567 RepID=A0AAD9DF71_9STRA|nr:hypothetical protein QTG54_005521 [Skeletonema marinoi]|mmetsp:Transcript_16045/g.27095  ORF Transcript_16045/g.27095 Transcript_16045/m.27095 type:complete len:326 (-) Transcript_16045:1911-2888(-)
MARIIFGVPRWVVFASFLIVSIHQFQLASVVLRKGNDAVGQSSHDNLLRIRSSPTILEECTVEVSKWPRPNDLSNLKYQDVLQAEQILSFLIEEFDKIGAPVTLMYGTMLREFRNGTKTGCLRPDYQDKDFDIAVSPQHFHYIYGLRDELKQMFNTSLMFNMNLRERMFTSIPTNNKQFKIDVYGYECKKEEGLIYFPWDMITIAMDSFFPVRRHKRILPFEEQFLAHTQSNATIATTGLNENNTTTTETHAGGYNAPAFYLPNNPPCLLENIYGVDYMTPRTGKEVQAKYGTSQGRLAHGNPICNLSLSPYYQQEFERQMNAYC